MTFSMRVGPQAYFTASCDVSATSVKGTRAFYLQTDLTVHKVPIPKAQEHVAPANVDMTVSGYLSYDGAVYFSAGFTCTDLYVSPRICEWAWLTAKGRATIVHC